MDQTQSNFLPQTSKRHSSNSSTSSRKRNSLRYLAIIFPILIPTFHLILFRYLWQHEAVDKQTCTCSCWDNVFKGPYENGIARYKHVYFNTTFSTFKIWASTIIFFIAIYEVLKRMINLFIQRKLRASMALLFFTSFHSHYYAWWAVFNYYNDNFNSQWNHQMVFTVTELVSAFVVVYYMDRRNSLQPLPLLVAINIAVVHIVCGSWDNFVENVVLQRGGLHQILRDVAFVSTDVMYLLTCLMELRNYAKYNGHTLKDVLFQKNHLTVIGWCTAAIYVTLLVV